MKSLFFVSAVFLVPVLYAHPDMVEIRNLFSKASLDREANNELYSLTNSYNLNTFPVYYAYNAAAEMILANHVSWPGTKLEHFNTGRQRLETAVAKFPENVEIRYIRYCVQQGCPFFLNYTSNLEEDKKFVIKNIHQTDWSETYKKQVKEFLNTNA